MNEEIIKVHCNDGQKTNCPIKLGQIYCDGYKGPNDLKSQQNPTEYSGRIGVFSHFHEDHIGAVRQCLGTYDTLIVHPITFKAISALLPGYQFYEQWIPQDYDTKYPSKAGDIRLLKSNHIPGSSQVHVEIDDTALLYSGDFNYPEMQIRKAEHLVLDATHGDPWHDGKTDRHSVKNRMFEDVKEKIELNKPVIIRTSAGTLQELIKHFEINPSDGQLSHDIPFVTTKKQKSVLLKIYDKVKSDFRDIIEYDSPEFWRLHRNNKRCVLFLTNEIIDESLQNYYNIIVDKYRFSNNNPAIIPFDGGCRYNLASHASIQNILDYVGDVEPKEVITDHSRSGYAPMLAKQIQLKYPKINAHPSPQY